MEDVGTEVDVMICEMRTDVAMRERIDTEADMRWTELTASDSKI